jgi:SAM-dependent methyltransferase
MREENINRLSSFEIKVDHPHYLVYKSYHSILFKCLKKYSRGRLLDIGCGNKPYRPLIESQITEYMGCDIVQSSEHCVDIISPATDIPLPESTFDTVISTQTIEHVAEHQLLVNEAYRLLKPGGYFIVSGPMYWPLHEEPYDFFRFTKHGFIHILTLAGFSIIEENANGGKWALCGQAFIHALYPDIHTVTSFKWKLIRKTLSLFGGLKAINRFFSRLDDKKYDSSNTMNYVFVAFKNV